VPQALGQLFGAIGAVEVAALTPEQVQDWRGGLGYVLQALGLVLPSLDEPVIEVPSAVQAVAERRWAARLAKDWAQADILRQELTAHGWAMKDGKENFTLTPL
jgi:cysteinyl-tRNA synthetase